MHCRRCSQDNPDGAKFCSACGNPLDMACPACGEPVTDEQNFCGACGKPLTPTPTTQSPYTPALLRDGPLTSRFAKEGENKQVTVLFCDIVESTALAERIGAVQIVKNPPLEAVAEACRAALAQTC